MNMDMSRMHVHVRVRGVLDVPGASRLLNELDRQYVPDVHARLARIEASVGSEHEAWAVQQAYALLRSSNFSRDVLERAADVLAVLPVSGTLWSDWGTPERVVRTLCRIGASPPWLEAWSRQSA